MKPAVVMYYRPIDGRLKLIPHRDAALATLVVEVGKKRPPPQGSGSKPVVKVRVGGPRSFESACWVYVMSLDGHFQKIGHSVDPWQRRDELQEELGEEALVITQARVFYDRNEALAFENQLHKRFASHRISPPPRARVRSREFYDPQAGIHL